MVIDARQANAAHRAPPPTHLAGAGCYNDLILDPAAFPTAGEGSLAGWDVSGNEADVADCFWNFTIDPLADWFGVDDPRQVKWLRQRGFRIREVWDNTQMTQTLVAEHEVLYPCVRGMCMGWSWSLHFANEAVRAMVAGATGGDSSWLMRDGHKLPLLRPGFLVGGVYVDNISILGATANDVNQRAAAVDSAAERVGLPIDWTHGHAVTFLESVGVELNLSTLRVRNKARRIWRFDRATEGLLRRSKLRGEHVQVWG